MPSSTTSTYANLTAARMREIAERDDCVVYEPTHDVVFQPWSAARVRECVGRIVRVVCSCESAEEARAAVAGLQDAAEFAEKYQVMYAKFTDPAIARNANHVEILLDMIKLREQVEQGAVSTSDAQNLVAERALGGLLAQAQAAGADP